jgi:hypothetical protein
MVGKLRLPHGPDSHAPEPDRPDRRDERQLLRRRCSCSPPKLPQDGDYVLTVRDTRYGGDLRYSYCVEISRGLPAVAVRSRWSIERGKADRSSRFSPLAVQSLGATKLNPAKDAEPGTVRDKLLVAGVATSAVEYAVSEVPQSTHVKAGTRDEAVALKLPCGVNGRLSAAGRRTLVLLQCSKGRIRRPGSRFAEVPLAARRRAGTIRRKGEEAHRGRRPTPDARREATVSQRRPTAGTSCGFAISTAAAAPNSCIT